MSDDKRADGDKAPGWLRSKLPKKLEDAPRGFHPWVLIPFLITFIWTFMLFAAPLSLPPDSVHDLSGSVGVRDNQLQTEKMNGFARWMYDGGDVNCHQKATRSLFINGNEMPYCARCTGIFVGLTIGTALSLYIMLSLNLWWILGGLIPMGIDGVFQLLGFWESSNPVRVLTGGLAGFVAGAALGYIFFAIEEGLKARRETKALRRAAGLPVRDAPEGPKHAEHDVEKEDDAGKGKAKGLERVHVPEEGPEKDDEKPDLGGAPEKGDGKPE
jgi:uncharacterized membrane protein